MYGENMQIICTQNGRKHFYGTWLNLIGDLNHSLPLLLLISPLSIPESSVPPSLNNSTRKSTGKRTLGKQFLS